MIVDDRRQIVTIDSYWDKDWDSTSQVDHEELLIKIDPAPLDDSDLLHGLHYYPNLEELPYLLEQEIFSVPCSELGVKSGRHDQQDYDLIAESLLETLRQNRHIIPTYHNYADGEFHAIVWFDICGDRVHFYTCDNYKYIVAMIHNFHKYYFMNKEKIVEVFMNSMIV